MDMLSERPPGDAHELGLAVEFLDVRHTGVTQRGRKPPMIWVAPRFPTGTLRHLAFHAFRHQLQRIAYVRLEVSARRTARHGADAAHAAIAL